MPLRKVEMLTGVSGGGLFLKAGQETEVPEPVAERWVAHGYAKYLDDGGGKTAAPKSKRAKKATSTRASKSEKR